MPCDAAQRSYGVSMRSAAASTLSNPGVLVVSMGPLLLVDRIDKAAFLKLVDEREIDELVRAEIEFLAADAGVDHLLQALQRRARHSLQIRGVLAPRRLENLF